MRPEVEQLRPYVERTRTFSGWSFPDLKVRHLEPDVPWDYEEVVRERGQQARSVLDMGTGGGEVLSRLRPHLSGRVVATEEWETNAPVARERLAPLNVDVVRCRSLRLPFSDAAFDLVINRHEELDPADVARVLRSGGCFVTQQMGRSNWQELRRHVARMTDFGDLFGEYSLGFAAAGLDVTDRRTHDNKVAFGSLGDFVFLLGVTPWTVPDFSLERDGEALLALEAECSTEDGLVLTESRYLIVAEKRGG